MRLGGADATGALGRTIAVGDAITSLRAKVKFESTGSRKWSFALARQTGEVPTDGTSTRAKELVKTDKLP